MENPSGRSITMRDIAQTAGVHPSTVSRALRDDPALPRDRCRAIQALAGRLGYRINPLVSALMASRRGSSEGFRAEIALLQSWPGPGAWRRFPTLLGFWEGARARAENLGYRLEEYCVRNAAELARAHRALVQRGVRGVVIFPFAEGEHELEFPWEHYASATIGYSLKSVQFHRAAHDQFGGALMAIRALRSDGVRRVGFVGSRKFERRVNGHWMGATVAAPYLIDGISTAALLLKSEPTDRTMFRRWNRVFRPEAVLVPNVHFARRLEPFLDARTSALRIVLLDGGGVESGYDGIDQRSELTGAATIDLVVAQMHRNEYGIPTFAKTSLTHGVWRQAGGGPGLSLSASGPD